MDMDNELVKKDYTEESGDICGWKSGVLNEPTDQLEKQKSSGKFIFICYFCQFVLFVFFPDSALRTCSFSSVLSSFS